MWWALWMTAWAGEDPFALSPVAVVLDNGLEVFVEEDRRTDSVALHLHYGVGARDERPGEYGCAHLFEHLMFEGSANVPTDQFDTWLTQAGGWNNAYTSDDETAYHMVFPSGALDLALFLESDRMGFLDAGLHEANLTNQQQVVLQERAEGYAAPHGKEWDALQRVLWPSSHPYHVPVIGTIGDVEGFQIEAVRDFWSRHYRSRNAVLAIVGNVNAEEAIARIEHWFRDVEDAGAPEVRVTEHVPYTGSEMKAGMIEDQVEDRTLWVAWPTVPLGHVDEPALDLASYLLSYGRGTRLDERLQLAGKATENGAYHFSGEIDGQFLLIARSERTPLETLDKIQRKEIARLAKKAPKFDEVERALRAVRGGMLDRIATPQGRASAIVDCWRLTGEADCVGRDMARYEAVTPEDIRRAVETWLTEERAVTLSVVPAGDSGAMPGAKNVELP